jgi:hypothetical protein
MTLTVSCLTCRDEREPRRIVSWRQSCRDCADLCVQSHLAEHPTHKLEITGHISQTPFGDVPKRVQALFNNKRWAS